MNEIEQLQNHVKELQTELTAFKSKSPKDSRRSQIATAVITAVCIPAVFLVLNTVAGAIRPGYFVHLIGGVALKDLEHVTIENSNSAKVLTADTKPSEGNQNAVFVSPDASRTEQTEIWKLRPPTTHEWR